MSERPENSDPIRSADHIEDPDQPVDMRGKEHGHPEGPAHRHGPLRARPLVRARVRHERRGVGAAAVRRRQRSGGHAGARSAALRSTVAASLGRSNGLAT